MQVGPPLLRRRVLLRTLCARHRGAPLEALAAVLSVSGETIRPSLQTFQDSGFPLEETIKDFGRKRRIDPAGSRPGLSFALGEPPALYPARRPMEPLA
jgi:predicted DNA-binding transcriptional regulator YafY